MGAAGPLVAIVGFLVLNVIWSMTRVRRLRVDSSMVKRIHDDGADSILRSPASQPHIVRVCLVVPPTVLHWCATDCPPAMLLAAAPAATLAAYVSSGEIQPELGISPSLTRFSYR